MPYIRQATESAAVPPAETARPAGWPLWLTAVLFGLAFWTSAEASRYLSVPGSPYVSFWLPAGIYIATLLLNDTRVWPWFMLAALAANLAFDLPHGTPFLTTLGLYCANTVEALAGAWLVRWRVAERPGLTTHEEFIGMAFYSAGLATTLGAVIGAGVLVASGLNNSFWGSWQTWWCNEALAILLVTPFMLSWFCEPPAWRHFFGRRMKVLEAGLLLATLVGVSWYLLVEEQGIMTPNKSRLMPFLLWAGLRFGLRGATAANLIFALLMGFFTTHFLKGLTHDEIASGAYVSIMQMFLGISIVMTLIPAIVLHERNLRMKDLQESEERFRNLTEASFEAVCITDNGRVLDVNDQGLKMLGYERHEVIGREIFECISPETRGQAVESVRAGMDGIFEHRLIRKDGSVLYAETRAKMVKSGNRMVRMTAVRDITERKQMEDALKAGEKWLRLILDSMPAAAYTCDAQGRITYFNQQAAAVWGRTPVLNDMNHRFCGCFRLRDFTGAVISHEHCWMALALAESRPITGKQAIIERPDGSQTIVLAHACPLLDAAGNIVGAVNVMTDITERIRTEEALRLSEAKFRSAMQHSPIGMGLVAPDGRWIEVNPALCSIVGYPAAELLATDFQTITHPDDLKVDEDFVRQMLARQIDNYVMEKRYLHKSGHPTWVQLNVSLVWNPDGSPRHFVSQIQDISERKLAEEALQINQAKLTLSMDLAKLFHWEYDVMSRRLTCDENLFKFYGTNSVEQGGLSMAVDDYLRKFIHPEDAAVITKEMTKEFTNTDPTCPRQLENRVRQADGSTGVMLTRFMMVRDAAGRPVKAYGVNQDITEQKKAEQQRQKLEEQLRQAQKMEALGTLAGGTAHEFNNMLGIIIGFGELAKAELDEKHPVQASMDEVLLAAQRAKEIVQQILTFSRQQRQSRQPIQMDAVVREAMKVVRNTVPASVVIQTDISPDAPVIMGNATQIHQVLMNICVNAWHAMNQGPGVIRLSQNTVSLKQDAAVIHPNLREGVYVHLAIADNGSGMDAPTLARIFEPFFTTKDQGKGTGLGLAVVHGIVQAHEGAIFAESQPGVGTTFHLYFPLNAKVPVKKAAPSAKPAPQGGGQHILLVDDELSLTGVAAKVLHRFGYKTTRVSSAAEALSDIREDPSSFDLVITDLTMPGMNGTELAKHLQSLAPALPVVLASGFGCWQSEDNFNAPNIRKFLQKPYTMEELTRVASQAILSGGSEVFCE